MVNELEMSQQLLQEFINNLPPEAYTNAAGLITILKTAGIIFIIYLVFLIVKIIFDIRSKIFIKKTYEKVNEIDEKLNKILKKKGNEKLRKK